MKEYNRLDIRIKMKMLLVFLFNFTFYIFHFSFYILRKRSICIKESNGLNPMKEKILLGAWSESELVRLIAGSTKINDIGERITFLSGQFLGVPYKESTLIGSATMPETLVINIEAFDCFTFLDCIEAMRLSRSFADFHENLIRVRYQAGIVRYDRRNHFFTDWSEQNREFVHDRTKEIGGKKAETVTKILNRKDDGSCLLPGIRPFERMISYIPSGKVNKTTRARLRTGDYVGIFSSLSGLDVSHVGIIIAEDGLGMYFRHASSAARKVIDEDFSEYIAGKPGIVVLRPR
jgi:hypothetical protein